MNETSLQNKVIMINNDKRPLRTFVKHWFQKLISIYIKKKKKKERNRLIQLIQIQSGLLQNKRVSVVKKPNKKKQKGVI